MTNNTNFQNLIFCFVLCPVGKRMNQIMTVSDVIGNLRHKDWHVKMMTKVVSAAYQWKLKPVFLPFQVNHS